MTTTTKSRIILSSAQPPSPPLRPPIHPNPTHSACLSPPRRPALPLSRCSPPHQPPAHSTPLPIPAGTAVHNSFDCSGPPLPRLSRLSSLLHQSVQHLTLDPLQARSLQCSNVADSIKSSLGKSPAFGGSPAMSSVDAAAAPTLRASSLPSGYLGLHAKTSRCRAARKLTPNANPWLCHFP
jgi:hypothetical protein